jgi:hypothetical protein
MKGEERASVSAKQEGSLAVWYFQSDGRLCPYYKAFPLETRSGLGRKVSQKEAWVSLFLRRVQAGLGLAFSKSNRTGQGMREYGGNA